MDEYMILLTQSRLQQQKDSDNGGNLVLPRYRVLKRASSDPLDQSQPQFRKLDVPGIRPSYDHFMTLDVGREIKEAICRVAEGSLVDLQQRYATAPASVYELPDGRTIDFGLERYQVTEVLFDPSSAPTTLLPINKDGSAASTLMRGVPRLIMDSVAQCDIDQQLGLLGNIVITGGGSVWDALPERIRSEVKLTR
jgi:actin-related protein